MAEGEGFEPSLPGVPVKRFSRPPHSAALPPFHIYVFAPKVKPSQCNSFKAPGKGFSPILRITDQWRIISHHEKSPPRRRALNSVAERWGFEPQVRFWRTHDFQSCSFSQTRTSLQRKPCYSHVQVGSIHQLSTLSQEKNSHLATRFLKAPRTAPTYTCW